MGQVLKEFVAVQHHIRLVNLGYCTRLKIEEMDMHSNNPESCLEGTLFKTSSIDQYGGLTYLEHTKLWCKISLSS
ncbi:hypothetical protein PPL_04989 [Heterostelium album PN500]|uniref:Uncharacterized protein n=1 Tax=Heterostelium pallidum (strain ATCC 26659 / Pp 5 / PN500) TaxID=670386 RepID=D3B945_HETP5|nr:hypothetical protein PPL_04989 [Heterostelium album PN500]EFA82084.1 hypothetical protein PPL_04989 [Heterostelium album PN500]|eukprot:XP_020434201.1 hypothetical protein PPL_04989 [Heterostelium album PN500]